MEESYKTIDIESIPETLDIAKDMPQVYSNDQKYEIFQSVPAFRVPSINSDHTPQDLEICSGKKRAGPPDFYSTKKSFKKFCKNGTN